MTGYHYRTPWGSDANVCFLKGTYVHTNGTYVEMCEETENGIEPFADVTVNLGFLMPGYAYLNVNELPDIGQFLESIGAGEQLDRAKQNGLVTYPLFKFNDVFLSGLYAV